jgi:hypothetical protein
MGLGVTGLRGENLVKTDGCFVEAALLEKSVGLGFISKKRTSDEEEKKRKGNADTCRRCSEHG